MIRRCTYVCTDLGIPSPLHHFTYPLSPYFTLHKQRPCVSHLGSRWFCVNTHPLPPFSVSLTFLLSLLTSKTAFRQ